MSYLPALLTRWSREPEHRLVVLLAFGADRQALATVFSDYSQHAERATVVGPIHYEVIRPDVMPVLRSAAYTGPIIQP